VSAIVEGTSSVVVVRLQEPSTASYATSTSTWKRSKFATLIKGSRFSSETQLSNVWQGSSVKLKGFTP